MSLIEIPDLPSPADMRGRWAASAAVLTALGFGDGCHAANGRWHYDDGGGNWADLVLVGDDRAVLLGNDHEYSSTYFGAAAEYFGEEGTDLLAGAPEWWAGPLAGRDPQDWVGFVYGFEDGVWRRADYDVDDGFVSLGLPAVDDEQYREIIGGFVEEAAEAAVPVTALDALAAADGDVDEPLLAAVFGGNTDVDLAAGVTAARAFSA